MVLSVSGNVNAGYIGNIGFSIGGAVDVQNNTEGFVGGYINMGKNESFMNLPKASLGITLYLHDSYNGNNGSVPANSIPGGVLGNLGGINQTYSGGYGLVGGYSYSFDPKTLQKADYGVETKSIGYGAGVSAHVGMSRAWTFSEIYEKIIDKK